MLKLYYNKYCDVTKFEELEVDTDSLFLAISEQDLYEWSRPAMKKEWDSLRIANCTNEFLATSKTNFFPPYCCTKQKKHDKREPGFFKEEFGFREMIVMTVWEINQNLAVNG